MFQFLSGSIKSISAKKPSDLGFCFNSFPVRLKALANSYSQIVNKMFQFLSGSIKRAKPFLYQKDLFTGFNSFPVRLKG